MLQQSFHKRYQQHLNLGSQSIARYKLVLDHTRRNSFLPKTHPYTSTIQAPNSTLLFLLSFTSHLMNLVSYWNWMPNYARVVPGVKAVPK